MKKHFDTLNLEHKLFPSLEQQQQQQQLAARMQNCLLFGFLLFGPRARV